MFRAQSRGGTWSEYVDTLSSGEALDTLRVIVVSPGLCVLTDSKTYRTRG
ncbi:hypothetical protein ACFYO2_05660 [Streptomyces sp. NPDC006602]